MYFEAYKSMIVSECKKVRFPTQKWNKEYNFIALTPSIPENRSF